MDIIKRKILLNKSLEPITLKIPLYQKIENMGLNSDMPNNTMIYPMSSVIPLEFTSQGVISDWYKQGGTVVYASDSKLSEVKSYDKNEQYKINFDMKKETYSNFESTTIVGVDRVTNIDGDVVTYVLDTKRDGLIGTTGQTTGTLYIDNTPDNLFLPIELDNDITKTRVQYEGEGWNETNSSLTPQIQEEYLLGIISQPEVKSDVFIDRTTFSVLDKHLRLSEIESLDHLTRYGNGFYNINRN